MAAADRRRHAVQLRPDQAPAVPLGRFELPEDHHSTSLSAAPRSQGSMLESHERHGRETPGPGDYGAPALPQPGGGRISKTSVLSYLDRELMRARAVPAPGSYEVPAPPRSRGRAFNQGPRGNETTVQMKRAAALPGPCDYGILEHHPPNMQQFNQSRAKSDVEWRMYFAAQTPGPATYDPPSAMQLDAPKGGRFNNAAKPLTPLDWALIRAREIPAPTDLDPPKLPAPKGGRFSKSSGLSELDRIERVGPRTPGPGDYEVEVPLDQRIRGGVIRASKAGNWLDEVQRIAKKTPSCVHSAPRLFRAEALSHLVVPATAPGVGFGRTKKRTLDSPDFRPGNATGPGDYESVAPAPRARGVRFARQERPMNVVPDPELDGAPQPGPGAYSPAQPRSQRSSQKFSEARPKTAVEWQESHARQVPGPGEYDLSRSQRAFGTDAPSAVISVAECPGFLDVEQRRARSVPPPASYKPQSDFTGRTGGGKFSTASKADAALAHQLLEASLTPGPGGGIAAVALKARAAKVRRKRRRREAARQARKQRDKEAVWGAMGVASLSGGAAAVVEARRGDAGPGAGAGEGEEEEQEDDDDEQDPEDRWPANTTFALRTINNRTFTVRGHLRWPAAALRDAAAARRKGEPARRFVILHQGKVLKGALSLAEQGVVKGSTMEWLDRSFM